jgi:hypothetical protein
MTTREDEMVAELRATAGWAECYGKKRSIDLMREAADRITALSSERDLLVEALTEAEAEARRFAEFYPETSDGRNTFVILADKIAALTGVTGG